MMTVAEMARLGGLARARKLSKVRREEIARKAGKAGGRARADKARKRAVEKTS
jgi:hypothetical protein